MTELRFHRDLYLGESVDEAVRVFEGHAAFELEEGESHWIVRVTAGDAAFERTVAGELGNYALGLTVKNRGTEG